MLISKAPLRITLGGGGTDLPSFYKKHGGFLVSGAINKYVYVCLNSQFYSDYSLKYSKLERAKSVDKIQHPLFREAIRCLNIQGGIELTSLADIPSGLGLGSSGAFLVSLLSVLQRYKQNTVSRRMLAEEACKIELDILKESEGKQDKYVASFGELRCYRFKDNGCVDVGSIANEDEVKQALESRLLLFYSGQTREGKASNMLKNQDEGCKQNKGGVVNSLLRVKQFGVQSKEFLENGFFDAFGESLNEQWRAKKKYNPQVSNDFIDKIYDLALSNGASGGKVMGAGGGGCFLFYLPSSIVDKKPFISLMCDQGLIHIPFCFDSGGVRVVEVNL